jgi:hypothetical protein
MLFSARLRPALSRSGARGLSSAATSPPGGPTASPGQPDDGSECLVNIDATLVSQRVAARYFEMWNTGESSVALEILGPG